MFSFINCGFNIFSEVFYKILNFIIWGYFLDLNCIFIGFKWFDWKLWFLKCETTWLNWCWELLRRCVWDENVSLFINFNFNILLFTVKSLEYTINVIFCSIRNKKWPCNLLTSKQLTKIFSSNFRPICFNNFHLILNNNCFNNAALQNREVYLQL